MVTRSQLVEDPFIKYWIRKLLSWLDIREDKQNPSKGGRFAAQYRYYFGKRNVIGFAILDYDTSLVS